MYYYHNTFLLPLPSPPPPTFSFSLPLFLIYHHLPALLHFILSLVILAWCDSILCLCVCSSISVALMLYDMSYFPTHYISNESCIELFCVKLLKYYNES